MNKEQLDRIENNLDKIKNSLDSITKIEIKPLITDEELLEKFIIKINESLFRINEI